MIIISLLSLALGMNNCSKDDEIKPNYRFDFIVDGFAYKIIDSDVYGKPSVAFTATAEPSNYSGDVVVPSSVYYKGTEYTVAEINTPAFTNNTQINDVTLPSTIKKINGASFSMSSLRNISIPASVDTIETRAFSYCTWLGNVSFEKSNEPLIIDNAFEFSSASQVCINRPLICANKYTTNYGLAFDNILDLEIGTTDINFSHVFVKSNSVFSLSSIKCTSEVPPTESGSTPNIQLYGQSIYLYVPRAALDAYKTATFWKNFKFILPYD